MSYEATSAYFRLLGSLLFAEPTMPAVAMLKEGELFAELPFAENTEAAREGQRQMCAWLESAAPEELTEQARPDYMRLLVGVGKTLAPPWGSVYLDEDRLLFNEDTLEVRRYYERFGMMAKEKYHEPDDHIGLEFEFLAYLFDRGEQEAARDFSVRFILPWVDRWNSDVQKYAKTDYYRALANLAAGGIHCLTEETYRQ
jgi:TorA maturation chaperone TorD